MDSKFLKLDDVALFVEVARRSTFSDTARALNIPVSTVSRRMSALEEKIAFKLFVRTTRSIELTSAGIEYYNQSCESIENALTAHERVHENLKTPKGDLRASLLNNMVPILPEVISNCVRQFPLIRYDFDIGSRTINPGEKPFEFLIREGSQPDSGLFIRKFAKVPHCLYASTSYLNGTGMPETPAELSHHTHIHFTDGDSAWRLVRNGEVEYVRKNFGFGIDSMIVQCELAASGHGIVSLPKYMQNLDYLGSRDLQRVLPQWELSPVVWHVLSPTRILSARARAFLDVLRLQLHYNQSL